MSVHAGLPAPERRAGVVPGRTGLLSCAARDLLLFPGGLTVAHGSDGRLGLVLVCQSNHLPRGIVTVVSAPENPSADVWRKPRMGGSSQRLGSPLLAHPRQFKRTDDGSGRGRPRGCGAAPGVAIGRSDREPPMKPGVTARTSSPLL